MIAHYIIQSVFVLVGILSLMASVFNWEWFFTAQNSQFIVRALGRNKSRIFYAILGLSMIAAGIYFFLSVHEGSVYDCGRDIFLSVRTRSLQIDNILLHNQKTAGREFSRTGCFSFFLIYRISDNIFIRKAIFIFQLCLGDMHIWIN